VIADRDAAAIVPQDVATKVLEAALAKVRAENRFRDAVKPAYR